MAEYSPKWVGSTAAREMLGGMDVAALRKLGREGVIRMCQPGARLMFRVEDIENLDRRIAMVRSNGRRRNREAA